MQETIITFGEDIQLSVHLYSNCDDECIVLCRWMACECRICPDDSINFAFILISSSHTQVKRVITRTYPTH